VIIRLTAVAMATLLTAGCATSPRDTARAERQATNDRIVEGHSALRASVEDNERRRIAAQDVPRPFIAGNTMPLARDVSMPAQLRRSVPTTANFSRAPVDLDTALRQISEATGMVVTATADANMPASMFAPRTFGPAASGAAAAAGPIFAPSRVTLPIGATPLWALLDDVARQGSLSWRPLPNGAEFFRVETRVFQIAGTPQAANTSASLGRNGGTQVFEATSKTAFSTADQNVLRGLMQTVDAMLSIGGKAQMSPENQTLVVTDTPANLARVEKFIGEQNRIMSRRVRVILEVLEVVDKDASEVGVDWNLLYGSASRALTNLSPQNLTASQAGQISVGPTSGPFAGSALVIRALSDVGVVVNRRFFPFLTTSGRPVTQAIRSTFNYVDQVQATTVPTGSTISVSGTAPTVTQKEETVGTFVTMVPTAKADDTIFLSLSFDVTSAQPLVPFTVGSSASQVTVQQKTIDGTGFIQELPVRSGQTVLVGGLESQTTQDSVRRLIPGASMLFGGSNTTKLTKTRLLLLVTAVAEEGV
jgi:type IVB pilus formation R64 PilN family outer membrane protein